MTAEEKRAKIADFSLTQAKRFAGEGLYGRSFPHYLVFAQLNNLEFQSHYLEAFLAVVHAFSSELAREKKFDKVFQVYEQALDVLPDNPELLTNYASHLFKQNRMEETEKTLRKALAIDPDYLLAKDRLENMAATLLDRWHFPMLNDLTRNSKFQRAIARHVGNSCYGGERAAAVLDVGTGTGLLSLFASQAGAARVFACEASEVMAITAADVIKVNQPAGSRITLIPKLSLDIKREEIPAKIQLLITETFDAGLLGEHVLETLAHAWETLLEFPSPQRPLATRSSILPARAEFTVAAIQASHVAQYAKNIRPKHGYLAASRVRVVSPASYTVAGGEPYTSENLNRLPGGFTCLTHHKTLFKFDFENKNQVLELVREGRTVTVELSASADGSCDALAGWFTLHLDDEESLSTKPGEETCWHQAIFPLHHTNNKVYKGNSTIVLRFNIGKHIQLLDVEFRNKEKIVQNGNGCENSSSGFSREENQVRLTLPQHHLALLNDSRVEEVLQWVAYSAVRDVDCSNILDTSRSIPLLSLQILKLSPQSRLTVTVDTAERETGRAVLDFITSVAGENSLPIQNISCVTGAPDTEEGGYSLAVISPVLASGRLDQEVMLGLEQVVKCLTPGRGLILPHKLQLWCQIVESRDLSTASHLVTNEPVLGFSIADQVNILAVSHLQQIRLATLNKTDLSSPVQVREIDLNSVDLGRQIEVTSVQTTATGKANAIVYWFSLDYGWGITVSTREAGSFSQAACMCPERTVECGESVGIVCQMEKGLINFSLR